MRSCSLLFVLDEFRPDSPPLTRVQVFARDLATSGLLDRYCVCWAWTAVLIAIPPLANLGITFRTNERAQLSNAESVGLQEILG